MLWTFDAFKDSESYQHLFYSLLLINNMLCGTRVSSYHSMWLYEKCTSTPSGAAREIVRHKAGKVGYSKPHARIAHIKQLCISFCYPDSEVHERSPKSPQLIRSDLRCPQKGKDAPGSALLHSQRKSIAYYQNSGFLLEFPSHAVSRRDIEFNAPCI